MRVAAAVAASSGSKRVATVDKLSANTRRKSESVVLDIAWVRMIAASLDFIRVAADDTSLTNDPSM